MVIGLIAAGAWIALLVMAVGLCRAAGRTDDAMASPFVERVHARSRQPAVAPSRDGSTRIALFPN